MQRTPRAPLVLALLGALTTPPPAHAGGPTDTVLRHFRAQRFDALEAELAAAAAERRRTGDGGAFVDTALDRLSRAVVQDESLAPGIAAWKRAAPKSARPHVLEARVELARAWRVRGTGFAHKVTEAGWAGFRRHLAAADRHLEAAAGVDPRDPDAAVLRIETALYGGQGLEAVFARFQEATALDPVSEGAHRIMAHALQARWLGSDEAYLAFARETVRRHPDDPLLGLLLVDVHRQLDRADRSTFLQYFRRPEVWAETSAAMQRYVDAYPDDAWGHNRYAWLAWRAGKKDVVRAQIAHIDGDWMGHAWEGDVDPGVIREWLDATAPPARPGGPARKPPSPPASRQEGF